MHECCMQHFGLDMSVLVVLSLKIKESDRNEPEPIC